jgi:hypothetical protein
MRTRTAGTPCTPIGTRGRVVEHVCECVSINAHSEWQTVRGYSELSPASGGPPRGQRPRSEVALRAATRTTLLLLLLWLVMRASCRV